MSKTPAKAPAGLKKELLRSAVQDNLSTLPGAPHAPKRRADAGGGTDRWWLWLFPVALVAAALPFLWTYLSPGGESRLARGVELPELTPSGGAEPARGFDAPLPLDVDAIPLAVRRIVIDPGHGGEDHGTTGFGLDEKSMTLDIALRLQNKLLQEGFEVHLTRETDAAVSLRERARLANELRADLFVSIHINWIAERSVRGLETYFLGATDDPELNELARRENQDSGYSLADMKSLLESIYTDVRQDESRQLATRIQRSLYSSLLRHNPDLKNRGVKTAPFVVLVATEMPAILAEVSCLSNADEAEILSRPRYREHIADALSRGIRNYADEVNQADAKGS